MSLICKLCVTCTQDLAGQATFADGWANACEDPCCAQELVKRGIPTFAMHSGLSEDDFGWGSPTFHKMVRTILLYPILGSPGQLRPRASDQAVQQTPLLALQQDAQWPSLCRVACRDFCLLTASWNEEAPLTHLGQC